MSCNPVRLKLFAMASAMFLASSAFAGGQCELDWHPEFGGEDGANGVVVASAVFDDGSGPALYVGGSFSTIGGVSASRIAKWDGTQWSPVGGGMGGSVVRTLAVVDDGTGPALYAAGEFTSAGGAVANNVAKWDGSSWSPVGAGTNGRVHALTEFNDGTGPALYAAGAFSEAGGSSALRVAKWDGTTWSALGSGMTGGLGGAVVDSLAVFNDGSGSELHAGGLFTEAGGTSATLIARWDGSAWASVGGGMAEGTGSHVSALKVIDEGTGPALYAGGTYASAGGVSGTARIAKWDGTAWSPLGSGIPSGAVRALGAFDDGGGTAVYAAGEFSEAGGASVNNIVKWDGANWSPLRGGIAGEFAANVNTLETFDDGDGSDLYAGGLFNQSGSVSAMSLAKWGCGVREVAMVPTLVDFGDVPVEQASGPQTATVENTGTLSLQLGTLEISGTNANEFSLSNDNCSGTDVLPAEGCTVDVELVPSTAGPRAAQIDIPSNAPSAPDAVLLEGTGVQAALDLDPVSLGFGSINVDAVSEAQTVTLTNTGGAGMQVGPLAISGAHAGDFGLDSNSCSGVSLAPTETCTFNVVLTPSATGPRTAQVDIPSDAPSAPDTVALEGVGIQAQLGIDPATGLEAGRVEVGESATVEVTVTNSGDGNAQIGSISEPPVPFSLAGGSCLPAPTTVAPGDSCTISVEFAPTQAGGASGSFDIISDAPSSPDTVNLTGMGIVTVYPVPVDNPLALAVLVLLCGLTCWLAPKSPSNPGSTRGAPG